MRISLALLLLAAVYIAVDAQYYIISDNYGSAEDDSSSQDVGYPVTLVSSPYSYYSEGSEELGRSNIYLTEIEEPYFERELRQGIGGGSGGGGYGGGGKKKTGGGGRGKGKGKKGKKGKKGRGKKKGGFWYYWGPVVKHVGWGWGHGGGGGGGGGGLGGGGGGYGGGGHGHHVHHHGHGHGGGGGGYGGGGGGGFGGGGGGGGGGGHGWGWKKPKIHHIHYQQPHFPDGKPLHIVKHPQVNVHHQHKGWGWGH